MKYIVTYKSKYGSTKKYAQWIAEELSCVAKDVRDVRAQELCEYDVIIHGGGLYAGGLSGIDVITKNFSELKDKRLIVFSCGLADPKDPENVANIEKSLAKAITAELATNIKQFHFRGGIDYGKLNVIHRAMMAMLRHATLKKGYDNLRQDDKLMLDTYGKYVDFTEKEMIAPLIQYAKQ